MSILGISNLFIRSIDQPEYAPDEIIIKFNQPLEALEIQNLLVKHGVKKKDKIFSGKEKQLSNTYKLKVPRGKNIKDLAEEIKKDPNVAYAEPNYIYHINETFPDDPYYSVQWALPKIKASLAWDIQKGSSDIKVAVIDTGVKYDHPDLAANMMPGYDFVTATSGCAAGEDCDGVRDSDPMDVHGHGTRVAGIIGAVTNNSTGIAGLNWYSKIMPLKAGYKNSSGGGVFDIYNISAAIIYAADNGANIINMSFGGYDYSYIMKDALDYANDSGVIAIAAAGNETTTAPIYPAAYKNVISVGATNSGDGKTGVSNYGIYVDVFAPGENIRSTTIGDTYLSASGTSYASPYVAGLASLILSQSSTLTPDQVYAIIKNSADDLNSPGWDAYSGWGRINAYNALLNINSTVLPEARISSPLPNTGFRNEIIEIRGKAEAKNFDHYVLEWGIGKNPSIWENAGVIIENNGQSPVTNGKLGTIDFSSAELAGYVTIRLTVFDSSINSSVSTSIIHVDKTMKIGWPKYVAPSIKDLTLADINKDGFHEYVLGTINKVYYLDQNAASFAGWPISQNDVSDKTVLTGDINNDQELEILSGQWSYTFSDNKVFAWDKNGLSLSNWPILTNQPIGKCFTLNPIGQNQEQILIAGTNIGPSDGNLFAWDGNGNSLSGWPVGLGWVDTCSVADFNLDGKNDIAAGAFTAFGADVKLHLFSNYGSEMSNWPFNMNFADKIKSIIAADLDGNGYPEIIAGTLSKLYALRYDATSLAGWPINIGFNSLAAGDVNGDGEIEIAAGNGSNVYLFNKTGQTLAGWPKTVGGKILLADVDGDGMPDILGLSANEINAWRADGSLIADWPKFTNGSIVSAAVGNIDLDGKSDLIAATGDSIYWWNLPADYNPASNPWPLLAHDSRRTNNIDSDIMPPKIVPNTVNAIAGYPIQFSAEITDPGGVKLAQTFYKLKTAPTYVSTPMSNTSGDLWEVEIPQSLAALGNQIQYYYVAHDGYLNPGFNPLGATTNVYETIVTDPKPPVLTHAPVIRTEGYHDLTILAQASDNDSVAGVILHYRAAGAANWESAVMNKIAGNYQAIISANKVLPDGLEYYIEAIDNSSNQTTSPVGAPAEIHNVQVFITVPASPEGISAQGNQDRKVTVSWIAPTKNEDGTDLTDLAGYIISYRNVSAGGNWIEIDAGDVLMSDIQGLVNGDNYEFKVKAYDNANPINYSSWSESVFASPRDIILPSLNHTPITDTNINTDIQINTLAQDNVAISSVRLYYREVGSSSWKLIEMPGNAQFYSAAIPGADVKLDGIEYFIEAEDSSGNISALPAAGELSPFIINVIDNIPPQINHIPLNQLEFGNNLPISAQIEDDDFPLASARVCADTECFDLTNTFSNVFEAIIPANTVKNEAYISNNDYYFNYYLTATDAAGNGTRTPEFNILMTDVQAPIISRNEEDYNLNRNNIEILANISDNHSIKMADLFYKLNDQSWVITEMLPVNPPLYSKMIQTDNQALDFLICATDYYNNLSCSQVYTLSSDIYGDILPPVISHQQIKKVYAKTALVLGATVTDDMSGVEEVILTYWGKDNVKKTQVMNLNEGSLYIAAIPASDVLPGVIKYSIYAKDKIGNESFTETYEIDVLGFTSSPVNFSCGCSAF